MKRIATFVAALSLAVGATLTTAPSASAAPCPSGYFCVWVNADFTGFGVQWSGDDEWWESNIADQDSSWANHGISGEGVKDHVQVFEDAIQWPSDGGDMTICLGPGQEVNYNGAANDRADSHVWDEDCVE
ncbi:peptidase inhibitor family I36 protein [Streptomyces sp. T-3]|nr:peptidase inhibitor family I36 protein [Streptomyces sp. T-3]